MKRKKRKKRVEISLIEKKTLMAAKEQGSYGHREGDTEGGTANFKDILDEMENVGCGKG